MAQQAAHPSGEGKWNLLERHARGYAQAQRGHRQSQRRMKPRLGNQEQQQQHRSGGAGQQKPIMG